MQTPEGKLEPFDDFEEAQLESRRRERLTGKPHPVIVRGEIVEIKGGKFQVYQILEDRLILKPVKY